MLPIGRSSNRISGLVVEYIVAIDVTRVRFPADALWRWKVESMPCRIETRWSLVCLKGRRLWEWATSL